MKSLQTNKGFDLHKERNMIMNAQMKSSIASENAQSPCFTYDHINHKIVGTELNFRKSGIPGSDQDTELMARLAEHPNYTFRIIKPDKEKNTYIETKHLVIYKSSNCFFFVSNSASVIAPISNSSLYFFNSSAQLCVVS